MEGSNKRFLTSGIILLEKELLGIKSSLSPNGKMDSVFTKVIDDIGAESKNAMMDMISNILDELKQIKENFGLEQKTVIMRQQILVAISNMRIVLEDLNSQNLDSYGTLTAVDQGFLDSKIMQIRDKLGQVNAVLH